MNYEYILHHDSDTPHCSSLPAINRATYIDDVQWAPGYSEPGYTSGKRGVLTGDWNQFSRRAYDLLERAGYSCEWEEEWLSCYGCGKLFRTSADSYNWTMYGTINDEGCYCGDCVKNDVESYLESLEDNPQTAITIRGINPADYGYTRHDGEYENGFHLGQTDDPKKIYQQLRDEGKSNIIFEVTGKGQFDIDFVAWYKASTEDETLSEDEVTA